MLEFVQQFSEWKYVLSAFIGIGLSAATGFRVFLPMFAVSLASYMGWIDVIHNDLFSWMAELPTLITTGIATVVEILAYYIPYVDNLLDTLSVPLATIAGSILFASQFSDIGSFPQWALALIAGGGTAAAVSSAFAGTRIASTGTTGGIANPVVTTAETTGAVVMTGVTLIAPVIAFLLVIVLLYLVFRVGRKIWRKTRSNGT
ncbi:glucan phosphoethanolaminetransferase (alkaline phosphatase superfamily) [Dysgonomonas sp. PFB1-18]|uniref:DUF4126 domain-containing protein n=1 Tax=unclassified Dysgonomonas TaxID=2630389 RepID=UPI0024770E7D|nr:MULTISPECIES: DUF4126 domain-containing protein [unclassified Dysgonomonas]MDH6307522.1 glucan phosphoethanolaminetransferase (alkaline phosphatase superfamily) [Dysgonomonas sp. PF1-14]MDH6337440.1 glucan phosphoethanolaminetransferase (alkaline phosphatase superfamily) [Dysgonomonas sp. PF1-16]MDH6379364.1 glucan phosphoethanolaminetransferase (alkaline phosphatase superfamily) [Dysgonomonas sp. PFB1-18]MDH6395998.1 glucan phosphoethanolaminetransferase (alkaline phosphatase superfamily) [